MTDSDKEECAAILEPLKSRFTFPPSRNPLVKAGDPAAFCGIEGRNIFFPTLYTRVAIYGVVDSAVQNSILDNIRASRRADFKPVIVTFYEQEIWTTSVDPDTGNIRSVRHEIEQEQRLRQKVFR